MANMSILERIGSVKPVLYHCVSNMVSIGIIYLLYLATIINALYKSKHNNKDRAMTPFKQLFILKFASMLEI